MQFTIHWELLAPAMLLLWVVLPIRGGRREPADEPLRRDAERPSPRAMARAWQNWVDLARACAGTLLVVNAIPLAPGAPADWARHATVIKAVVLGVGVLLQVVRWGHGIQLYAPCFYLTGLTPLLSGPLIGGFACLFGWLFVLGMGETRILLLLIAGMAGVSAFGFGQLDVWVVLNAALLLSPLFVSFLAGRFPLHVCRGLRPAVPVMANSLQAPEFRRVESRPDPESPATPPAGG
ncbi:MAG TPA: hypothetical protein DCM86_08715 [Verrucomicrobiales bacterium]|nr:hypothetical protein [Verrucomicrobiales bacterium]